VSLCKLASPRSECQYDAILLQTYVGYSLQSQYNVVVRAWILLVSISFGFVINLVCLQHVSETLQGINFVIAACDFEIKPADRDDSSMVNDVTLLVIMMLLMMILVFLWKIRVGYPCNIRLLSICHHLLFQCSFSTVFVPCSFGGRAVRIQASILVSVARLVQPIFQSPNLLHLYLWICFRYQLSQVFPKGS